MFYFCEQCAQIENVKSAKGNPSCPVCDYPMQEVPAEYLMSNGSFFRDKAAREELLTKIRSSEVYRPELAEDREAVLSEKQRVRQAEIEQRNAELKSEQEEIFSLECPICHGKSVSKLSNIGKVAKVYAFGLFGTGDLGKKYKCNLCGAKF